MLAVNVMVEKDLGQIWGFASFPLVDTNLQVFLAVKIAGKSLSEMLQEDSVSIMMSSMLDG